MFCFAHHWTSPKTILENLLSMRKERLDEFGPSYDSAPDWGRVTFFLNHRIPHCHHNHCFESVPLLFLSLVKNF